MAANLNDATIPVVAAKDIGKVALGIFLDPSYKGKSVGVAGFEIKPSEMMKHCSELTGKSFQYVDVTRDQYAEVVSQ